MNWFAGRRIPRWLGAIGHLVGFPAAHALVPYALSLLGTRHGWVAGWPGGWNFVGLLPVAAGFYVAYRCLREHFALAPDGWVLEKPKHYPTPAYLATGGPYRYSRHPIYLAEAVIWAGWIVFYASFSVLGVFVLAGMFLGPVILPREERGLEAKFGEEYRRYTLTTPRWLGRAQR